MVTDNHYRWDFIQLSTDTKPTPATSPKVVDGSTLYTSDNSKLYVWYKDRWYEKTATGGGGGGSYTAGDGIDITNDTISVDTDTIQEKLTAGAGIDITDNTISATGGGGELVKTLTSADYNWNSTAKNSTTTPFDCFAIWLLPSGMYKMGDEYVIGDPVSSYKTNTTAYNNSAFIVFRDEESGSGQAGYTATLVYHSTFEGQTLVEVIYDSQGAIQTGTYSNGSLLKRIDIVNNLTSNNAQRTLSAAQGKVLKGLIDELDARVTALGG